MRNSVESVSIIEVLLL